MPTGISLLKLLKRNPPTDSRNLIEPNADVRYLGMKLRAGQTKNLFELLDASSVVGWWLDEKGRFIMSKYPGTRDYYTVTFLRTPTAPGEGGTWLQDVIDLALDSSRIDIVLPSGTWSVQTPLNLSTDKVLSITGSGYNRTELRYEPTSPTSNPLITFTKHYNKLSNLMIAGTTNVTSALIVFSNQNNLVENCFILAVNYGLSFTQDYNTVRNSYIRTQTRGLTIAGQATTYDISNNIFEGNPGTYAISQMGGWAGFGGVISSNIFRGFPTGLYFALGIGADSVICNNVMESTVTTKFIDEAGSSAYLINGNVFNGSATFTISANSKTRANIGLADQN